MKDSFESEAGGEIETRLKADEDQNHIKQQHFPLFWIVISSFFLKIIVKVMRQRQRFFCSEEEMKTC